MSTPYTRPARRDNASQKVRALRAGLFISIFSLAVAATLSIDNNAFTFAKSVQMVLAPIPSVNGWGAPEIGQEYFGARDLLAIQPLPSYTSTHPPTAFLFALPIAALAWPQALAVWEWSMLACLIASAWAYGLSLKQIILLSPLVLLWPPALWSFFQLTPIWLLALALAWRYRDRPALSGALIAIASLPKYFAAMNMLVFRKQRRAWLSFATIWICALLLIAILHADIFSIYLTANASLSPHHIARLDNGAWLAALHNNLGIAGLAAGILLAVLVAWSAIREKDSWQAWACWTWLGVGLLPIAWVYSLLPLLPWLIRVIAARRALPSLLACLALIAPFLTMTPAGPPLGVVACLLFSGIAFSITRSAR